MRAFVFPGQGSQKVGMGTDLAAASAAAREVFEEVNDALGQDLAKIMAEGPEETLTLTENAQPAIMANAMAVLRVLGREFGVSLAEKGEYVAGHSLGEYTALCAARSFSVADTARLLKLRGQAMQAAVPVGVGAMCALLGADIDKAAKLAEAAATDPATGAKEVCTVANDNDPTQVVLSGHAAAIDRAIAMVKDFEIKRGVRLPVSAPFHCPLMGPAAEAMDKALTATPPGVPILPVFANVTAQPVADPEQIHRLLVEQVTGRVRWRESAIGMGEVGVTHFVELGGKVLGPMIKRSFPDATVTSVVSMEEIEALAKEL
ncbi:ACP S-malonyltransferase [Croceicoccus sp. BE223]|uniref:ACP S-malonyltransferase n=1 Tax=Croceicoccus sp. BE223 TaxID=2817716 RepID=UPI00286301E8|nr:ACP S-malonyltransferase [Croceicoccus sp. BE223]MDR7102518.1 [acyl-carrier-protein] S-malonyltransferase [Croceicoccus sp. BE223]